MFRKLNNLIKQSYNKQIDGTGLALFRIAYGIVLLCEVCQLFYFNHLAYDKVPYLVAAEIDFSTPYTIWIISLVFIILGLFTRLATIVNYIIGIILISNPGFYTYHMFFAYMGINFLIIFLPVSRCLSLDRLIKKLKYSNTTFQYNPSKNVRQISYFLPLYIAVALVYTDSIFFKLASPNWYKGLGCWLPASLPYMTHFNSSWILNIKWLNVLIGWTVILFEFIFLFIFFRKKFRWFTIALGFMLHLGIFLLFPIPWFGLGVTGLYLLVFPVSFWKKVFSKKSISPSLTFYYDSECPLCVRTKITIEHFDTRKKIAFKTVQFDASENPALVKINKEELLNNIYSVDKNGKVYNGVDTYIQVLKRIWYLALFSYLLRIPGIYHIAKKIYQYVANNRTLERCTEDNCGYNPPKIEDINSIKILNNLTVNDLKFKLIKSFLIYATVIQIVVSYRDWFWTDIRKKLGVHDSTVDMLIRKTITVTTNHARVMFGLTNHPVFCDKIHFDNYNHIVGVVYIDTISKQEKWLPLIDEKGMPGFYAYGNNFVHWTFLVNSKNQKITNLNYGIERYTAFWAHKNKVDLHHAKFLIKVKKIESTNEWQYDFLNRQIAKPWIDGGFVEWKDEKFHSSIKDIETL